MIWSVPKPLRLMAPDRQEATHRPQPLHRTGLISALPAKGPSSIKDGAEYGQISIHTPQLLQKTGVDLCYRAAYLDRFFGQKGHRPCRCSLGLGYGFINGFWRMSQPAYKNPVSGTINGPEFYVGLHKKTIIIQCHFVKSGPVGFPLGVRLRWPGREGLGGSPSGVL